MSTYPAHARRMSITDEEALACGSAAEWREWLAANGRTERSVWLIVRRDEGGVNLATAVEHALCFGWIDSKTVKRDDRSTYQCFTPRNPRSTWSKVNRDRVDRLTAAGLMEPPGQALIDHAHHTGTWDLLADAQNLIVPADLAAAASRESPGKQALPGLPTLRPPHHPRVDHPRQTPRNPSHPHRPNRHRSNPQPPSQHPPLTHPRARGPGRVVSGVGSGGGVGRVVEVLGGGGLGGGRGLGLG